MGGSPVAPAWRFAPAPAPEQGSPGYDNLVGMKFERVNPPSLVYVTRDDQLYVRVTSVLSTVATFSIRARILTLDNALIVIDEPVGVTSGGIKETLIQMAEGFLFDVVLRSDGGTQSRGINYAQVMLARGNIGQQIPSALLCQGYIVGGLAIGWPFGRNEGIQDSNGFPQGALVSNPAAGADWTFTLGTNVRARVIGGIATLTTSAAVATRGVRIVITDGGGHTIFQVPANLTQAASLTQEYNMGAFPFATTAIVGEAFVPLPPGLLIPGGYTIGSVTNNIQAADQWSAITLLFEDWMDHTV